LRKIIIVFDYTVILKRLEKINIIKTTRGNSVKFCLKKPLTKPADLCKQRKHPQERREKNLAYRFGALAANKSLGRLDL
jgi:hypothetical protein